MKKYLELNLRGKRKMIREALDEKYSYQIDEHGMVHLFRGEEDCQQYLTNPLLSAIFKIEALKKENEDLKEQFEHYKAFESHCDEIEEDAKAIAKENADLKEQVEQMKCCGNCQSVFDADGFCYLYKDGKCINQSEWVKNEYNLVKKEKNNE